MSAPLYNQEILRLATSIPHQQRSPIAHASIERRSPTCGSRIIIDVCVDDMGVLSDLGLDVRACALGQASASLMAAHAKGRTATELARAAADLRAFLAGEQDTTDFWPGIDVFAAARDYPARHPSIMLAFDAVSLAMQQAIDIPKQGAA